MNSLNLTDKKTSFRNIHTCMHLILPPLLTLPRPAALLRRLTGRPAVDLRPWKGATEVADEAVTVGAIVLYWRREGGRLHLMTHCRVTRVYISRFLPTRYGRGGCRLPAALFSYLFGSVEHGRPSDVSLQTSHHDRKQNSSLFPPA